MPATLRKASVLAFTPWFNIPIDSCEQPPPVHGYLSPPTTQLRGHAQSMVWNRDGRHCTYCAHDRGGQQRPDAVRSADSNWGGGGTTQAGRSTTSSSHQIGPVLGSGLGRAAQCKRCSGRPTGDVLRQYTEARLGCSQLQKERYQIGCRKEGLRIRTDGVHLSFVDRREGSMVHCLRETGRDDGGG